MAGLLMEESIMRKGHAAVLVAAWNVANYTNYATTRHLVSQFGLLY